MSKRITIDKTNMPREKMKRNGVESLSDVELLVALLGSGNEDIDVFAIANNIYNKVHGNLYELEGMYPEELYKTTAYTERVEGVGEAFACLLIASAELGKRIAAGKKKDAVVDLSNPELVADTFKIRMKSLKHEEFHILHLNAKLQMAGYEKISSGGLSSACADPSKVFLSPIKKGSRAIIVAHNHPSGDPNPSQADIASTNQLRAAGKILGIELLDHIIIAGDSWFSFAQDNLIK